MILPLIDLRCPEEARRKGEETTEYQYLWEHGIGVLGRLRGLYMNSEVNVGPLEHHLHRLTGWSSWCFLDTSKIFEFCVPLKAYESQEVIEVFLWLISSRTASSFALGCRASLLPHPETSDWYLET
jgi:hypothetical protein